MSCRRRSMRCRRANSGLLRRLWAVVSRLLTSSHQLQLEEHDGVDRRATAFFIGGADLSSNAGQIELHVEMAIEVRGWDERLQRTIAQWPEGSFLDAEHDAAIRPG